MATHSSTIATNGHAERVVVGYVRVSTDEQVDSGAGLAAQRASIAAEAARRGWTLLAIQEDAGVSGKSLAGRPGLQAALRAVERGDASALVVAKLDRLSRSLLDFAALMDRSRRQGWALVALDLGVDTTTPSGELLSTVVASVAQYERRLIGQRTREALAIKREQGVRLGRPPVLSEEVAARIRSMRRSGLSFAAISARLNAGGVASALGGRWHRASVRRIAIG